MNLQTVIKLTSTLVVFLLGLPASGANICDGDNIVSLSSKNGTYRSSKELFAAVGKSSTLHIFGEAHFYTETELLRRIITELSREMLGAKKCVFLELPKGGLKMAESSLKAAAERPDLSESDRNKIALFSAYYPAIVDAAEKSKMQVFEIDHPDYLTMDKSEDERNEAMAHNATQLLSDSSCESAIFLVGKAHISPLENRSSVVDAIRLKGIKPVTYNLVDFAEQSDPRMVSWSMRCALGAKIQEPKEFLPIAFSNLILKSGTDLYPFLPTERKAQWRDFDFTIAR